MIATIDDVIDRELVQRVAASTGLTPAEAARVIGDVLAHLTETPAEYVRRRHAHLKTYGAKNPEIYARLVAELQARPFRAEPVSERQVRRMIYG